MSGTDASSGGKKFRARTPQAKRMLALAELASGKTQEAAAKAAGVPVRSLARWQAEDPEFGELLAQAQQELLKEARRRLRGYAVKAVENILVLADTAENERVRLEATQDVLDRMLGKAPTRIAGADEELPPLMVQFVHPRAKREQEEEAKKT